VTIEPGRGRVHFWTHFMCQTLASESRCDCHIYLCILHLGLNILSVLFVLTTRPIFFFFFRNPLKNNAFPTRMAQRQRSGRNTPYKRPQMEEAMTLRRPAKKPAQKPASKPGPTRKNRSVARDKPRKSTNSGPTSIEEFCQLGTTRHSC
jgi:hypothetical protein